MFFDIAITAGGILPFYLGLLGILTKEYEEKFSRLFRIFLMAGLTTVPFFGLRSWGVEKEALDSLFGPLFSIITLAFAEELVKSIALYFDRELRKSYSYPIVVGLGFAFFENISYFLGFDFTVAFLLIALFRLFMVSTAHAVFTSLIQHFIRKGGHKTKTLYYFLGLLIAGSAHSLFNLLHHWEMSYLIIPLLVVLIVFLHFDEPASVQSSRSPSHRPARLAPARAH
ncbi:MAG: PrsW family glutamic-type intramembrane protease [Candidatus Altimarinota bacterium]